MKSIGNRTHLIRIKQLSLDDSFTKINNIKLKPFIIGRLRKLPSNILTKLKLVVLFWAIGFSLIHAQIEPMPPYDMYQPEYQTYRYEKDLYSFNLIEYLFLDKTQKVWLASIHDLKRTNGYQFFNVSHILKNKNHLKGHIIDGRKWNDSTQYLIEQSNNHGLISHALTPDPPISIIELNNTQNTSRKLLFYDVLLNENAYEVWTDSLHNLSLKIIDSKGYILHDITIPDLQGKLTSFCVTRNKVWFVVNNRRIIAFDISREGTLSTPVEIKSADNIRVFHSDQFDNIWICQWNGVSQIRKFTSGYELSPVLPIHDIDEVFEDNHGNLILTSATFPNNTTSAYMYIREGGRWISMTDLIDQNPQLHYFAGHDFQEEIFLVAQNNLSTIRFTKNPISETIVEHKTKESRWNFISRGIYKTDSVFYVLARNRGLLEKNLITGKERMVKFTNPVTGKPLRFDCLRTIEVDSENRLWFSACESLEENKENKLIVYDPKTQKSTVFPYPYPISAIQMGKDSILWVASHLEDASQKITQFNVLKNKITAIHDLAVNISRINDIHLLNQESMLLGTNFGLYRYSLKSAAPEHIPLHSNAQVQTTVFSIFDFDKKYFLASRDGLFIYTPGKKEVAHYTMDNGLRNNIVTSVFREKKNKYWLGTFFGVTVLSLDENLILNYSTRDGLPENEYNLYSYFQDQSGFYLGYPNGVLKLNLTDSMTNYFSDFGLDHALVYTRKNEKSTVLFPENNHLKIPPDVAYFKLFPSSFASYFIDYFDYQLINTTRKDTILFSALDGVIQSNLEAGTYQFKLSTFDRYGNKIPITKAFTITVRQHFYQVAWFRLLLLLLANILIGSIIYLWLRNRSQKKRKEEDRGKRLAELELQVLQAQLNPHFIFNTISAIQYYIQDHDEDHADQYLTSFSRLMRLYLDSSKSSFISIRTEINLLKNYLDLEIMVADGRIRSQYEIDPAIDLANTVIPTMMLQPFVENAIQHGLFHKKGNGIITLRFIKISEDILLFEIEDDGIGRRKAELINQQKPQKPTSRALQIINEKLEVLKATQGLNIEIEIIDKYYKGEAKGTLVQIKIPVIKKRNDMSLVNT